MILFFDVKGFEKCDADNLFSKVHCYLFFTASQLYTRHKRHFPQYPVVPLQAACCRRREGCFNGRIRKKLNKKFVIIFRFAQFWDHV